MTLRGPLRILVATLIAVAALALALSACGSSSPAPLDLPGDPRAGLSIYKYEGCAACHAISQVSVGSQGPSLDGVGNTHNVHWFDAMLAGHIRAEHLQPLTPGEQRDLASYLATLR